VEQSVLRRDGVAVPVLQRDADGAEPVVVLPRVDAVTGLDLTDVTAVFVDVVLIIGIRERGDDAVPIDACPGVVGGEVFLVRVEEVVGRLFQRRSSVT
jgi:hypothetical protein